MIMFRLFILFCLVLNSLFVIVVSESLTLDQALYRLATQGQLAQSYSDQKEQAIAGIEGANALNNSELSLGLVTGVYRQWDRVGPEEPSLPSEYYELESHLFDNDFFAPRLTARIGLSKPIWDGGLTRTAIRQSKSKKDVAFWQYQDQLLEQKIH